MRESIGDSRGVTAFYNEFSRRKQAIMQGASFEAVQQDYKNPSGEWSGGGGKRRNRRGAQRK